MGSWTIIFPIMLWLIVYLTIGELGLGLVLVGKGSSPTHFGKYVCCVLSDASKSSTQWHSVLREQSPCSQEDGRSCADRGKSASSDTLTLTSKPQ